MKKVATYIRTTDKSLSSDEQRKVIQAFIAANGLVFPPELEFIDEGKGSTEKRPAFEKLKFGMMRHEFDGVVFCGIDRLGNTVLELLLFEADAQAKGITLYDAKNNVQTDDPFGAASFHTICVFLEMAKSVEFCID